MKITILPSAQDDLATGFSFYENQQQGLGEYFLESLFSDIDSLLIYAGIHMKVFGYYRLLSKRFAYAIYYSLDGETLHVKAVLDCRRDPSLIKGKLEG
jgi:plasmid stabilization system protein ParE